MLKISLLKGPEGVAEEASAGPRPMAAKSSGSTSRSLSAESMCKPSAPLLDGC